MELYDCFTGEAYPLDNLDEIYIGRDVPPGHVRTLGERFPLVSWKHAVVYRDGENNLWIKDLESKHGTWVNGERLEPGKPVPLKGDSHIDLGGVRYYFIKYRSRMDDLDLLMEEDGD